MKSPEEIQNLLETAEQMRGIIQRRISQLMEEDEDGNRDEILSEQTALDRQVGAIQAYKTVLGV
jgi:hypothetical protein